MARSASVCVKRYLQLLDSGPRPTTTDLNLARERLDRAEERLLGERDPIARLHLHQEVLDARAASEQLERIHGDFEQLEEEFVECAAEWAKQKGISRASLREVGVSAQVLRRAGVR